MTETIIGNYQIAECIGRGGMGVVYRGRHIKLPREVAIKMVNARDNNDFRRLKSRFEREAFIQSQLDHPGIVKVYDYIVTEGSYYIVMEYIVGQSLAQLLGSAATPMPVARTLRLFEQILNAIAYAHNFVYCDEEGASHRGIIHRDLKPANILVTPDDRTKVTDFGIVKFANTDNTGTFGVPYGTPHYVSPEQAQGEAVDQRSDIYSLGTILYEMLTGVPPFGRGVDDSATRTKVLRAHIKEPPRPPSELNPEITSEVEAIVLRALEKKPERRFATATDFLRAVRQECRLAIGDAGEAHAEASTGSLNQLGTQDLDESATRRLHVRENYVTQPLRAPICAACGEEASTDQKQCKHCGHELNASPATTKIARGEVAAYLQRRNVWLVGLVVACALAVVSMISVRRASAPDSPQAGGPASLPQAVRPPQQAATRVPSSELVEVRPSSVQVDSSFDGYSLKPLTDDIVDVRQIARLRYNLGNWASAETPVEHWIELGFDRPIHLAAVYVYWGFDRNRYVPSRRVELQVPIENSNTWRTVSAIEPDNDQDRMAFDFAPLTTNRVRIMQPAQQGPKSRPFVMWMREVKVFGLK